MEYRSEWSDDHKAELGIVTHEGREFKALGSVVTELYATGYPHAGKMLAWDGSELGTCRVVAKWRVNSWIGSHMHQIEATINGRVYTGRGFGDGCLWTGKAKRS